MELSPLTDQATLTEVLNLPLALIYKHSTRCWASHVAHKQVESFAENRPDLPIFMVDVIRDRPLSQEISSELQVRHESPQVILVRTGVAQWHASHYDVTQEELEKQLSVLNTNA